MGTRTRLVWLCLCWGLMIGAAGGLPGCTGEAAAQTAIPELTPNAAPATRTPEATRALSTPTEALVTSQDMIREMLSKLDRSRVISDLRKVSGETQLCNGSNCAIVSNRLTGSSGLQRVKTYVRDELLKMGYAVEIESWSRSKYSDQNLIARKTGAGAPGEVIYLVAHMDGVKLDGERFPAADDNGSGMVDLLETARVLQGYTFQRTIVLLFSTGEEQGMLGAKSHIQEMSSAERKAIRAVINVDMIGYDANQDGGMQLFHGGHTPSKALTSTMVGLIQEYRLALKADMQVGCG